MLIKANTAIKLPVILIDDIDFKTEKTLVAYNAAGTTVKYRNPQNPTIWAAKTLAIGDWTELGNGVYDISFTAAEIGTASGIFNYYYKATGILAYFGAVQINANTIDGIETKIDTVKAKTDLLAFTTGNVHSHLKAKDATLGLSTQEKADVNIEADIALADYDPPTRLEATADKNAIITEVNANETKIDTLTTRIPSEVAQKSHLVSGTGSLTPPTNKGLWDVLGDGTDSLNSVDTKIDTLVTRVPSEVAQKTHLVNGTGNLTPPLNKGLWDTLGDGTDSLNSMDTKIDAIKVKTDNLPAQPASVLYHILGSAVYDSTNDILYITAYLEKDGALITTPTSATCNLFDQDGTQIGTQMVDNTPDAQGIFKFTQASTPIVADKIYYAKIAITYNAVVYTGSISFATTD